MEIMGLYKPPSIDESLKHQKVRTYLKILQAMYQLREENKYVISWSLLSERTALDERTISDAALELRANGFFDTKSQEAGVVSLTSEQFKRGLLRTRAALLLALFKKSRLWQFFGLMVGLVVWFGLPQDILKGLGRSLLDFFKGFLR
jgi:hypothetical protein